MTRGRPVTTALDVALHIARQRGPVMKFSSGPENFAHFLIREPGMITFVMIRYASRLHGTPEEIEAMNHEAVARLRSVPGSAPFARELWLYSRYGCWRYFRITDTGIGEAGRENMPPGLPASPAPPAPGQAADPVKVPAPSQGA